MAELAPTATADPAVPAGTYTVSQLAQEINAAITQAFPDDVWVVGQIKGNVSPNANGHVYFNLLDPADAGDRTSRKNAPSLRAVLFRGNFNSVMRTLNEAGAPPLTDGLKVLVRGEVDYYAPTSGISLVVREVDPQFTLGALALERKRILTALENEGLLRANASHPLPLVPLDVVLVTSDGSAAYNDFVSVLQRSPFAFQVHLADARVQGADAEADLLAALDRSSELTARGHPHVVVVVRGGGSSADLLAFDLESVARRIAAHDQPVITGIGHQIDRSVTDEVAHTAHITPTACAEFLVQRVAEFDARLSDHADAVTGLAHHVLGSSASVLQRGAQRLSGAATSRTTTGRERLTQHMSRLPPLVLATVERRGAQLRRCGDQVGAHANRVLAAATPQVESAQRRLGAADEPVARALARNRSDATRLTAQTNRLLRAASATLSQRQALVEANSPQRVLARGFSITRDAAGTVLRDAPAPGSRLVTQLANATVTSEVTAANDDAGPKAAPTLFDRSAERIT